MALTPRFQRWCLSVCCVLAVALVSATAAANPLDVPYDSQNNMTTSCGSCGSASTGMGLAYLGGKNSADEVEGYLYGGLECAPGESSIIARANEYCASHGLASPCAKYFDWGSSSAWDNLVAEINAGRPFVAHVQQYGYGHYLLVTGYGDGQVYLNDPVPSHKGWRSWSEFTSQWGAKGYDGIRFLLDRTPDLNAEFVSQGSDAEADPEGKAYYRVCTGQKFHFWFEVKNTGKASWVDWDKEPVGQSVRLGNPDDQLDPFTQTTRISINSNVNNDVHPGTWNPPGGDCNDKQYCQRTVFASGKGVEATAPATPGVYKTTWRLVDEKRAWFGPVMWLSYNVVDCPEPELPDAGVRAEAGRQEAGSSSNTENGPKSGRDPRAPAADAQAPGSQDAGVKPFPSQLDGGEEGIECSFSGGPAKRPATIGAALLLALLLSGFRLRSRRSEKS